MVERVKSEKLTQLDSGASAGDAKKPARGDPKAEGGEGQPQAKEAVSSPENGSGEQKMPPIPSVPSTQELEQGQGDAGQAVLDSPRDFGIHVGGILIRFRKGRTPLTPELAKACEEDSYVKDNGAEVIYRNKK